MRRVVAAIALPALLAAALVVSRGTALAAIGDITEFPIPTANTSPLGITKGSDGNLWFLEFDKVGKVTPGGVFTEYVIPTPTSSPFDITAGPDGNIWFTETSTNKVAKVTTSGAFTEYSFATNAGPYGIVSGPDGNLWVLENAANKVAKVTTSGVITDYPIPSPNSGPFYICLLYTSPSPRDLSTSRMPS